MPGKEWTEPETKYLERLKNDGYSTKDICRIMNRTPGSIHGRLDLIRNKNSFSELKPNEKKRNCLRCKKAFISKNAGNRLCNKCNNSNANIYNVQYAIPC